MTGKITVGTIQDTDGNTLNSTFVTNATPKYYIHWGFDDFVIDQSFNSSSVTDEGVGHARLNFTNNMSAPRYSFSGDTNAFTSDTTFGSHHPGIGVDYDACTVKSPTNALGYNTYHSSASIDAVVNTCQTFGDLA